MGDSVDSFLTDGDPVAGQPCPGCHRETVVYNGNYFCTRCPWIMGDGNRPTRIIKAYLSQRWLRANAAGDQAEMDRMSSYLVKYADA